MLLVAQLVYVLVGFGAGLIAIGPLAILLPDVQTAVVLLMLVNLPAEVFVVVSHRRAVQWRGVALVCGGIAVGVPLGSWVLGRGNPSFVLTALALFLLLCGLALLAARGDLSVRWPRWSALPVGAVAGALAGLFGTGGPPLILYYRLAGTPKDTFRSNLMAIFLAVTLVRLPTYALLGLLELPRITSSLLLLPLVLLGAVAGHRLQLRVAEVTFQRLVALALALIGALLLLR